MNLPMYANARKVNYTPYEHYTQHLQALVNDRWTNSTQTAFNIGQETAIGSKEFMPVDISVDTAIDIGTGFKKGDDFKVFSHRNISHEVDLGTIFKSDSDYWICINTNGFASPTNSCEVRRCNNVMKWVDHNTGYIHQEWCAIDYELSSPQPLKDKDVVVANGHVFITVQGNENTRAIEKNQRFIFNGQPYKMVGVQSLLNDSADITHSTLLYVDLYLDTIQPSDDLINNIANATEYQYEIDLQPDVDSQINGFVGQMSATVLFNNKVVERNLVWSGNRHVNVNQDGSYTLIGSHGDKAVISVSIDGNTDYTVTHTISIVDVIADDFDIVITPMFEEVRQNMPITFSVYLYNNGVQQDDDITWGYSGVPQSCFDIIQDGHIFTLSVKDISPQVLSLTFSAGIATRTIDVMLKPFF